MPRLQAPSPIVLTPVFPNAGVSNYYANLLDQWIMSLHRDTLNHIVSSRVLALDASPQTVARTIVKHLKTRWLPQFDSASRSIAQAFVSQAQANSDIAMVHALKKAGFAIRFQETPRMTTAIESCLHDNIHLIKTIPGNYLDEVEKLVAESVHRGRSMKELTQKLGSMVELKRKSRESDSSLLARTRRRAAFIARDQNNKATAAMNRARRAELGITECIWKHTEASKSPRESHIDLDRTRFDSEEGAWDWEEQDYIQPGELCNCGCVCSAVIPGFRN